MVNKKMKTCSVNIIVLTEEEIEAIIKEAQDLIEQIKGKN